MIMPTVGRIVWYTPPKSDTTTVRNGGQPLAALIATVWSETSVNLAVFDANGVAANATSVPLLQDDPTDRPPEGHFCEWMPYQKIQAAKNEDAATLAPAPPVAPKPAPAPTHSAHRRPPRTND
jgi:hypothetical protein